MQGNPIRNDMKLERSEKEARELAFEPVYPNLRYNRKTRKKNLTYSMAVDCMQTMFVQQSQLWKGQALKLEYAMENLPDGGEEEAIAAVASMPTQPWSASTRQKGCKRTIILTEHANDQGTKEGETINYLKERLNSVQRWRFEREEESASDQEEPPDVARGSVRPKRVKKCNHETNDDSNPDDTETANIVEI